MDLMPTPIVLRDPKSGSVAHILPELGFNCFRFEAAVAGRVVSVIDADPNFSSGQLRPSAHGIPVLFPYPNRIRGGRYEWNGAEHRLPLDQVLNDSEGNAIHGLCVDRPWRLAHSDSSSATGRFRLSVDAPERSAFWPADFEIELRYEVRGPLLRADFRIRNPGATPLPWGLGTHPYFRLPLAADSAVSRCTVEAPVTRQWELQNCLPTGKIVEVPEDRRLADAAYVDLMTLDDVFTGLEFRDGTFEATIIDEQAGLQVVQRTPPAFREFVVCQKPGRAMICLEPYTCTTDAINLQASGVEAGLRTLPPGGEFQTWFEIEASLVLA